MKAIVAILADLESAPLGQRSRLSTPLCGEAVLRRTVARAARAEKATAVFVRAPSAQCAAIRDLLSGLPVRVEGYDAPRPPFAAIVRAGRQWGLDGWRGGIGGLCCFDEDAHPAVLAMLAQREQADVVACVPAHAALLAPDLLNKMIGHYESLGGRFQLTFTPAPPGLAATLFATPLLAEIATTNEPPGVLLAYSPSHPGPDLLGKDCAFRPAAIIGEARGRLLADTHRSFERMQSLLAEGADAWPAQRVCERLIETQSDFRLPISNCQTDATFPQSEIENRKSEIVPEEIEIELTTADPWADSSRLRPRGSCVGTRGPLPMEVARQIAAGIRDFDDVRIVLGGFGEPLRHPHWPDIVRTLRDAGAMCIALRTSALGLTDADEEHLFALPVDVVTILLDATTPTTYRTAHGIDGFAAAKGRIERWMQRRIDRAQVRPLIVPEMVKSELTLAEMEPFFDEWIGRLGWATITGYSHAAHQRADLSVSRMTPPRRVPCRRLRSRMMVLADGRVTACDQDFAARSPLGDLTSQSLAEIWNAGPLAALRAAHARGDHAIHPLCPHCDEWHRP